MKQFAIAFFGTPEIAVFVLDELEKAGIVPSLVVSTPDKPQGRKMLLNPPPVKVWAKEREIEVVQPGSLREPGTVERLRRDLWDLFIVAAYGSLIPKDILDIPKRGTLNVHPSLLPKFRGASPIRSAILADKRKTGVTIMLMDEEMDHGPIVAQEVVEIPKAEWPMRGRKLDRKLARAGGKLLASVIPEWIAGARTASEQEHKNATFCGKITKAVGEIDLSDDPYQNLLKIRAYDGWPGAYFFTQRGGKRTRIKITDAKLDEKGFLQILRVIPEGKKETDYQAFLASA